MIRIYDKNEINFISNGLGIITGAIMLTVYEELNGRYDIELEVVNTEKHISSLKEDNIIKTNVLNKEDQLFRIKVINKGIKTTRYIAYHITYDLNNNFVTDVAPVNKTCQGAMQWVLDRAIENNKFIPFSDIESINSARYVRKNLIEILLGVENSIINIWGGELYRDNYNVKIMQNIGADRGYKISYGKNLREIKWNIDITQIITKIMPQGADELLLPELFVESSIIENYPTPIIRKIEFSQIKINENPADNEVLVTRQQAEEMLRAEANKMFDAGVDRPIVTVEIDMIELSKTEEYKERYKALETIYLGDYVTAIISSNIQVKLQVIAITYNSLSERIEGITLGQKTTNYFEDTATVVDKEIEDIKQYEIPNTLKEAKDTATTLIQNAMGGYVYKTNSELYIMDKDNIYEAQKVWRWNISGLGYSSTGIYGEYKTAITADGKIVADFITVGKLAGNIIDSNSVSVNAISEEAKNNMISESGLENLIKNSSGYNSYRLWNLTGINPTIINDNDTIENTVAERGFHITTTIMKQDISVMKNEKYTLSLKLKKGTGTSTVKIIQSDADEIIFTAGINEQIDNWKNINYTFISTSNAITLYIQNQNSFMSIADIMLASGGYPKIWTSAKGEIYSNSTLIDGNGIEISNTGTGNKFIANNEKVGVYRADDKIFNVNNETVEVKNLYFNPNNIGSTLKLGKIHQIIRSDGVDFTFVK